jgi:hypothetical protein
VKEREIAAVNEAATNGSGRLGADRRDLEPVSQMHEEGRVPGVTLNIGLEFCLGDRLEFLGKIIITAFALHPQIKPD